MAEEINNSQFRKEQLQQIIRHLHDGMSIEEARAKFGTLFAQVSAEEISAAEQALIDGGLPVSEVQRLCEVHAAVFEESIVNPDSPLTQRPGHPAHTLLEENAALRALISRLRGLLAREDAGEELQQAAAQLSGIDSHYKVKENLLFPYLEKAGVSGPPQVMWGVDDEIRAEIREALKALEQGDRSRLEPVLVRLEDMAFKEEQILMPMLLERLDEQAWRQVALDAAEFGHFLIPPPPPFPAAQQPAGAQPAQAAEVPAAADALGRISLPTGDFTVAELAAIFNTLPLDVTFVDKDNKVRFFSQTPDRAFPRTRSVLGRDVANCHPPASVHIVEQIVADLKSGKKDCEDFWINLHGRLILIRYFALRDEQGQFLGVLETTQDIAPLKAIEGEKRLMS